MTAVTVSSGSEGAQRSSGGEDRQAGVLCTPLDTAIFASASHGDWERDDAEGATATVLVRAALRFVLRGYAPPPARSAKAVGPKVARPHLATIEAGHDEEETGSRDQLVGTGGYAALTAANRVEMAPFKLRCVETRRIVHRSRLTVIRRFVTSIEPARHCNTQIIMTRVVRGPRPPSH